MPSEGQERGKKFATLEQAFSTIIRAKADGVPFFALRKGFLADAAAATTGIFTKFVESTAPGTARLLDLRNSYRREGFDGVSGHTTTCAWKVSKSKRNPRLYIAESESQATWVPRGRGRPKALTQPPHGFPRRLLKISPGGFTMNLTKSLKVVGGVLDEHSQAAAIEILLIARTERIRASMRKFRHSK